MNKQQLASRIWESANKMRSKIEANDYKDYILGFIFYKFLSDKQVKTLEKLEYPREELAQVSESNPSEDIRELIAYLQEQNGYFISYENLFSTWLAKGKDFDVKDVRDALSAFSRLIDASHKKVFDRIFDTLQTGLSRLGESAGSQTKAVSDLIHLIKDIPMDGKQDYDVLGFVYEYLISMFAANAGKKAGEFYTPHEVSLLMSEIISDHLKDREHISIYDPTSGSGSLLINIGQSVAKYIDGEDKIQYYAQELKENTYNLTRMNLVMRGIKPSNITTRNADTLEDDWPYFDESDPINTYNPLYVDAVVSNPPYSQAWDPSSKEGDPRYANFGYAPKTKADFAFLLHDLYHLKPDGIMTIVLPHGVLFRGGEEGQIRKNLIERGHIDAIIGLPANIFFGTGIPTVIIVLKQKRQNTDILMIDASKGFIKVGKNNQLRASDIKKIADTVIARCNVDKFARVATLDEIRQNDYNLNIPRYVDSAEAPESWDIYASMFGGIPHSELAELSPYWQAFGSLKDELFLDNGTPYVSLKTDDIKTTIAKNTDVAAFKRACEQAFLGFDDYLRETLIENWQHMHLAKQESIISEGIFNRLKPLPLIDKYHAYQILDDHWVKNIADFEMLKTEGFAAVKQVDPNLVIKKKDGKEQEVQDGWRGHILPFELVQAHLHSDEITAINTKQNRLNEISSEYERIIEEMSEEDKESAPLNEAKDSFTAGEVNAFLKKQSDFEPLLVAKIKQVADLMKEEKALKAELKKATEALHLATKNTIENLSDNEAKALLEAKWITPLVQAMTALPNAVLSTLTEKVQHLADKYRETYAEVATQIQETEQELVALIDELEGGEFDMLGLKALQALLNNEKE